MKFFKSLLPVAIINEIALFAVAWKLPDTIPVHINVHMEVDRMGSRWFVAMLGLLPIALLIGIFFYRHKSRNNKAVTQNRKVENILLPAIVVFFIIISWFPALIVFQYEGGMGTKMEAPLMSLIFFLVGLLMVVTSNFMGVIKQNRFLGIRTPWTLRSETVWKKTHRLGGQTGVIGGVLMCVFAVLGLVVESTVLPVVGLVLGLIFTAFVPMIYSYVIYKKEQA